MKLITLLVFVTMSGVANGHNIHDVNITHVIEQYILVCGYDKICDKTFLKNYPKFNIKISGKDLCPWCSCQENCVKMGNCCPDKFLTNRIFKCIPVTILPEDSHSKISYQMISYCPKEATEIEKNKCENKAKEAEQLTSLPVTASSITYPNEHCARCNKAFEFSKWALDTDCKKFVDFNFLSSYQEIWDEAKRKECLVSYYATLPFKNISECFGSVSYTVFKTCNVTGFWKDHNADIEWACHNYDVTFKTIFKNVFCYICNPLDQSNIVSEWNQAISTCDHFYIPDMDEGIKDACALLPETPATYPFKNIFCYFCNVGFANKKTDIRLKYIFEYYEESQFIYYIAIEKFLDSYFVNGGIENSPSGIYSNIKYVPYELPLSDTTIHQGETINVTELALYYLAYTSKLPTSKFSKFVSSFENFKENCTSDATCLFNTYGDCCIDLILKYPYSYIRDDELSPLDSSSSKMYYYVTHRCLRPKVSYGLKSKCESSEMNDSLSIFPVKSTSGIHYKNWYCYVCNEQNVVSWNVSDFSSPRTDYKLWHLVIKCPVYVNYEFYPSVKSIITAARKRNCTIRYEPNVKHSTVSQSTINKCPNTWKGSKSVKWACEGLNQRQFSFVDGYKNMFCEICNIPFIPFVDSCNVTGLIQYVDPYIKYACLSLPLVPGFLPFKNIFCELCNQDGSSTTMLPQTSTPTTILPQGPPPDEDRHNTYRSIFSLPSYDEEQPDQNGETENTCHSYLQMYDSWKDMCRNKTCYPGKRLINDTCIPLLQMTVNLGYILYFRLDLIKIEGNKDFRVMDILDSLRRNFLASVLDVFGWTTKMDIEIYSLYALTSESCDSKIHDRSEISISIYTKFLILDHIRRLKIENWLLESKNRTYIFTVQNSTLHFQSHEDIESLHLPVKTQLMRGVECAVMRTSQQQAMTSFSYRFVYVSKLLICDQIVLEKDEFRLDKNSMLHLMVTKLVLKIDEYEILSNGQARICLEKYPTRSGLKKEVKMDAQARALSVVTLICTVISLFCLFATFLTYTIFPSLRTVPGKNNMALVFAIFFSQLLLQFGLFQDSKSGSCVALGIFIHWIWISMFGCMNMCSFHMFRVFRNMNLPSGTKGDNLLIMTYLVFSYGLPAVIVVINVVVHLGTTGGADTGYGDGKCFISNRVAFIVSFLIPVLITCVLNIIYFAVTFYKIRSMPKLQSTHSDRNEVGIYLKLFTLTGITWLFQVIDSFLPLSPFSFIVAVLNGLQGLFIFVSYMCNHRVVNLYRKKLKISLYATSESEMTQSTQAISYTFSSRSQTSEIRKSKGATEMSLSTDLEEDKC